MHISKAWPVMKVSTQLFLAALFTLVFLPARMTADNDDFNRPGNTLIADQFNNRVIEVDPDGNIVWQFGGDS